ncbi:MAG TPA: branched-chain amino acid ABC transporter permease [Tepidisphaeraceae bacterium]|nr:branched-chain amino acid ABC transporter permease [Tepidisphaeraceae bacterium]
MLNPNPLEATHRQRIPAWVINVGLTVLIFALYPLDRLMQANLDDYYYLILVQIGLNIILATSLNLINGITGQFSLGHAAFMAIGAYTTGSILRHYAFGHTGEPKYVAMFFGVLLLSGMLAAIAGLLIGIPVLRLRGDYLAIATLGFGEIIHTLIINTDQIGPLPIGGASGLHSIPLFNNFFWTYAVVVVCVVCIWRLVYSTKGKAFLAVREDEIAAAAMGVNTTFYKVAAFMIGAFFAGVAGGLSGTLTGNLDPESYRFMRSIEIVVMVVLGGSGSITGAIIAAAVLTYLPEGLRYLKEWTGEDLRMVIYSVLLILMMLLRPEGLLGKREVWWTRRTLPTKRGFEPKVS